MDKKSLCEARWEAGRPYPCVLPRGHEGPHMHPMDYVKQPPDKG